ncbi:hypothetical protein PspLS_05164 [Pyricularia sp. CBS 133598]|nr:hypothetical protein PspLS_05164 [Pyricularia sp. CBS 133598]
MKHQNPRPEGQEADWLSDAEIPTDSGSEPDCTVDNDAELAPATEEEIQRFWEPRYDRDVNDRIRDMKKPLTIPWDQAVSQADVERLEAGYRSRSMEERWDVLIEDPDDKGGWSLHIFRSWLYEPCYVLHVTPELADCGRGATFAAITWEGEMDGPQIDAEQAKKEAITVCRWVLGAEFAALPDYSGEAWKYPIQEK